MTFGLVAEDIQVIFTSLGRVAYLWTNPKHTEYGKMANQIPADQHLHVYSWKVAPKYIQCLTHFAAPTNPAFFANYLYRDLVFLLLLY